MFKNFHETEGGFTLVELLVTIAILAVLFGIVTLTLSGVGANAQTTVCAAEVAVVQSAVDTNHLNLSKNTPFSWSVFFSGKRWINNKNPPERRIDWCPHGDSNPGFSLERAMS